jgi:hypothetical protein
MFACAMATLPLWKGIEGEVGVHQRLRLLEWPHATRNYSDAFTALSPAMSAEVLC